MMEIVLGEIGDGLIHDYANENKLEDNSDEDYTYSVSFRKLDLWTNIAIMNNALKCCNMRASTSYALIRVHNSL